MASGIGGAGKTGQIGVEGLLEKASLRTPQGQAQDSGDAFSKILTGQLEPLKSSVSPAQSTVKFSAHAIERMRSRGIAMDSDTLAQLEKGIEKAAEKGSKNSLVLMGDSALIVSIQNRTVITAVDKNAMKENVFTNIDSTVIL